MTVTVFVDTNVFVYSRDATEPEKRELATAWLGDLWEMRQGRTSFQVLNEYYVTVTRKLEQSLPLSQARADVQDLLTWDPVSLSESLLNDAWSLEDRFGFSWWDSLIVAAARASGSEYLLTEDLQHGQRVDALEIVSPFELGPDELR
jgi:predicted nucleic acid-binding protein